MIYFADFLLTAALGFPFAVLGFPAFDKAFDPVFAEALTATFAASFDFPADNFL